MIIWKKDSAAIIGIGAFLMLILITPALLNTKRAQKPSASNASLYEVILKLEGEEERHLVELKRFEKVLEKNSADSTIEQKEEKHTGLAKSAWILQSGK